MPQHGTIHDSLCNAFSFGLFAAYELESEDRELLRKLISEYRSQYRRPNDARLIGKSDEELIDEYYGLTIFGVRRARLAMCVRLRPSRRCS